MKIAIRYGHLFHGVDTGAEGYVKETDVNRRYGALVIKKLQALGYEAINVTPPEGSCSTLSESLYYGINKANNEKADLFLSCHVNANVYTNNPMGCEVVYNGKEKNKTIAEKLCLEMASLGLKNRGAKEDVRGLAEIRSTHMPCYIIEPFFVDSRADVDLYNKVGDEGLATAIVKAVTGKIASSIQAKSTKTKTTTTKSKSTTTSTVPVSKSLPIILKSGSQGNKVKNLQQALTKLGFNCGIIDGTFGNKTEIAVKAFQKKYGLTVDGVAGAKTLDKLETLENTKK